MVLLLSEAKYQWEVDMPFPVTKKGEQRPRGDKRNTRIINSLKNYLDASRASRLSLKLYLVLYYFYCYFTIITTIIIVFIVIIIILYVLQAIGCGFPLKS